VAKNSARIAGCESAHPESSKSSGAGAISPRFGSPNGVLTMCHSDCPFMASWQRSRLKPFSSCPGKKAASIMSGGHGLRPEKRPALAMSPQTSDALPASILARGRDGAAGAAAADAATSTGADGAALSAGGVGLLRP
jgi:hypothetical protein